jgi:hypothetical protein
LQGAYLAQGRALLKCTGMLRALLAKKEGATGASGGRKT